MAKQLKERVQVGTDDYGKPIYKWATGYTRQELLMNAAQLLLECGCVKDNGQGRAHKHLFRDYAQHWFTVFKEPTVRPLTARNYAQQLKLYLYPTFGEMMVEDITPTDIQKHLNTCQHLAKETQMRQLNVLRMIMDMAVEDGLITLNPVKSKKVHLTNQSRQERQPLTREEMMDAISRIPRVVKPLDRCFIAIQALHAMRPCEVLGLKWEDIDMEKGVLHIRRNVVHPTRNLPVVGDTKTQLSKRAVGISQIALPYIQEASRKVSAEGDFLFGVFGNNIGFPCHVLGSGIKVGSASHGSVDDLVGISASENICVNHDTIVDIKRIGIIIGEASYYVSGILIDWLRVREERNGGELDGFIRSLIIAIS